MKRYWFNVEKYKSEKVKTNNEYEGSVRCIKKEVELSASDLKVCLDISKAYGIEEKEKPTNIIENLPFDELEKDQNEEEKL